MVNDALRVARKWAPNMAQEINKQYVNQPSVMGGSLEDIL